MGGGDTGHGMTSPLSLSTIEIFKRSMTIKYVITTIEAYKFILLSRGF